MADSAISQRTEIEDIFVCVRALQKRNASLQEKVDKYVKENSEGAQKLESICVGRIDSLETKHIQQVIVFN